MINYRVTMKTISIKQPSLHYYGDNPPEGWTFGGTIHALSPAKARYQFWKTIVYPAIKWPFGECLPYFLTVSPVESETDA